MIALLMLKQIKKKKTSYTTYCTCTDLLCSFSSANSCCYQPRSQSVHANLQLWHRILVSSGCLKTGAWIYKAPKIPVVVFFVPNVFQPLTCATSSKSSCLFCSARALCRDFPTPVCLLRKASPWFSIQSSTCQKRRTSNYLSCLDSTEQPLGWGWGSCRDIALCLLQLSTRRSVSVPYDQMEDTFA